MPSETLPASRTVSSKRARYTGTRLGLKRPVAKAFLSLGHSVNAVAAKVGLSYESVQSIRDSEYDDPALLDALLKQFKSQAVLAGVSCLAFDPEKIETLDVEKRLHLGLRYYEKLCASPEQSSPGAVTLIQNNYGLQSSHSASQATVPTTIPSVPSENSGEAK